QPEPGARFLDPHHPFASDLDIFGHASLFELLSTARTRGGEDRLAAWLKAASGNAPGAETLTARHEAVKELPPLLDLREKIAVLGDDYRTDANPSQLAAWSGEPARPFAFWKRALAFVFALMTASALIWWLSTDLKDHNARLAVLLLGGAEGLFA